MKTKIGHYYIFFTVEDFNEKFLYWKSQGRKWINDHKDPVLKPSQLPCVLNVDSRTMMHGIVNDKYFTVKSFPEMYKSEFRKHQLKKILN